MSKGNKIKIIIVLILFILLNVNVAFTYSRYISNSIWNYFLKSKDFFFVSNKLEETTKININTLWQGESTYFTLTNALNEKNITKYDINFTLSCKVLGDNEKKFKCAFNNTNDSTITSTLSSYESCYNNTNDGIIVSNLTKKECELQNYEWINQISNLEYYFDIIPLTDEEPTDIKVRVEAQANTPYKHNLSAEFSLHKTIKTADTLKMQYTSTELFDKLTISNTYKEDKCMSLEWDTNNYRLFTKENIISKNADTNNYINKIGINIKAKESLTFDFQKYNKEIEGNINMFTLKEVNC